MKLTKQDILNIDKYLRQKGIKYMDVRYELMDHLVSEYESIENYPDLESFLRKRIAWCRKVSEEKSKSIHWGYQKALQKRIVNFLKEPVFYGCFFLWGIMLFTIDIFFEDAGIKFFGVGVIGICLVTQIIAFFRGNYFGLKLEKKVLSYKYLFNIYSLPMLFLQFPNFFNLLEFEKKWFWVICNSIAFILIIAANIEVALKRKKVLTEYTFLKTYFEE